MGAGRHNETGAIGQVVEDLAEIEKAAVVMGIKDAPDPTPKHDVVRNAWKKYKEAVSE